MKKNHETFLNVHGIKVLIISNAAWFSSYLEKYFNFFLLDPQKSQEGLDLIINISTSKKFDLKIKHPTIGLSEIVGDDLGLSSNGAYLFSHKELSGSIDFTDTCWKAEARFKRNLFKHLANIFFFRRQNFQEYYARFIIRYLIQNLIFLKLEISQNIRPASGAAIAVNGRAYLFFGLPGSGKSTVLKKIKEAIPRSSMVTENFILLGDKSQIFVFNEGNGMSDLESYRVAAGFIISHGDQFEIQHLDHINAAKYINLIDQTTAELPPQSFLSGYTLLQKDMLSAFQSLDSNLLHDFPIFRLTVDKNAASFIKYFYDTYGH